LATEAALDVSFVLEVVALRRAIIISSNCEAVVPSSIFDDWQKMSGRHASLAYTQNAGCGFQCRTPCRRAGNVFLNAHSWRFFKPRRPC